MGSSWYSRKAPGGAQRGETENWGEKRGRAKKVLYGEGDDSLTESDVGENEMEELILICEDSVEGILTAIYRIYEWKLCGKRVKIQTGASDLCLFAQYREVMPDAECAAKVARTLRRRFGEQAWECNQLCAGVRGSRPRCQAVMRRLQLVCPVGSGTAFTGTCRAMYPSGVCTEPECTQGAGKSASVSSVSGNHRRDFIWGDCAGCRRSCVCYAAFCRPFPVGEFCDSG